MNGSKRPNIFIVRSFDMKGRRRCACCVYIMAIYNRALFCGLHHPSIQIYMQKLWVLLSKDSVLNMQK